ncbi:Hypoxanthine-guanine-xanthine phosphoribosyltransferase [Galdieria sulphuraria]|uniref:Hypoxanthine phosphoribosyltransferase n=1 Tax=Galdieria sulphuraria TaxID=130081 RepID=M2WWI4_GALSU|nr:hypoxanthine phosphoribosyltransferase [Galdieria sulphuraria]EME28360.1 hypoxanthine phosphoribosyltransferase [Galdieria sulphuraria]GJD12543.1 Hypoxanthine-guanine-xanthine phosphoribosyltransferase [Galdieria sulphuraria]|eukprot:XP_005704880.1 hypoxanthine phosphoribosyltransferase [Galdieria sulphuraria]
MSSQVPEEWKSEVSDILFDSETIQTRIRELGKQLSCDYRNRKPVLLGVLTGSFVFLADLIRNMTCDLEIRFMRAVSYEGTESTGTVTIEGLELLNIQSRDVLLVEDIVDTGLTLKWICEKLEKLQPKSLKICTFLSKKTKRRKTDVPQVDYVGFECEDQFVVGYGFDCDQRLRQLNFVGIYNTNK